MLASFFSCDASEDKTPDFIDKIFLSGCEKSTTSDNGVYAERLNLILLMKPSCFSDEEISVPLVKLQATIKEASFHLTTEKKIQFIAWIKDEYEFFDKPIKLKETFVKEIYCAAKKLASTQICMPFERFEIILAARYSKVCEFKNGKPTYHEDFMKNHEDLKKK